MFKYLMFILAGAILSCSGHSTQALLDAELIFSGQGRVKLSTPTNNSTIFTESSLTFNWQAIRGVGQYLIEIADSGDFKNIVLTKTVQANEYAFQRADLKSGASLGSISLYWRISIPGAKQDLRSEVWQVNLISDSVFYVDCTFTGTGFGTQTAPFKTIQVGLDSAFAVRLGVATATAEVRVAKGTCSESIVMRANVRLKGGYDPAQNWTRNPASNQSIISSTDSAAVQGFGDLTSVQTETLVEGFKIQTTNTAGKTNSCVNFIGATLTMKNNYLVQVTQSGLPDPSLGLISLAGGANLTLTSNIVSMSSNSAVTTDIISGLLANYGNLTATNNIFYISSTNANQINGLYMLLNVPTSATFSVQNNTIFISYTASSLNNSSRGIATARNFGTLTGAFDRNIIYYLGPAKNNRCGQQASPGYFSSFKSNAMIDCNQSTNGFWFTNANIGVGYAAPWLASSDAGGSGASLDIATGLAQATATNNPVNCAGSCAALSGNRGGSTIPGTPTFPGNPAVVFQGYSAGDPTTFAFKPNTIADMDNNGAYDAATDAGANASTAGLIALP